jgi:cytochrome c peroxidase
VIRRLVVHAAPRVAAFAIVAALAFASVPTWTTSTASASQLSASSPTPAPAPAPASTPASFYGTPFERHPDARALAELGRALFFDRSLSASGRMACATCHDPARAYGPPNARAVQSGGASGAQPGLRAVPSLMYRQDTPPFSEHYSDNDGNDAEDQGPTGGFDWDGRAASAHEQAEAPLLSPFEMANADRGAVVARVAAGANAPALRGAFGPRFFDDPKRAWNGIVLALEVFQQSPQDFYPYASKYDDFLRGKATLSPAEARGLALFNDRSKGNCATCHPSGIKRGAFPQFTDLGFIALGVPRNHAIAANRDPAWFDLGLCGPVRTDLREHAAYCGLFKTPSLRNVATRGVFFHNGVFTKLEDVVRFYAQRDSHPERFYPRDGRGGVSKYDDMPVEFRINVNADAPFGTRPRQAPALNDREIKDIVAFLETLNDRAPAK